MTRRNTPLEVEQVEQLALIARLLPHHGESPSLISQADGITVRQSSRALFQQHRPKPDSRTDLECGSSFREALPCGASTLGNHKASPKTAPRRASNIRRLSEAPLTCILPPG